MTFLLEVAAGESEALRQAHGLTGHTEAHLRKAAGFFVEQMLLSQPVDHYRILGCSCESSTADLRRHMALIMRWLHPDVIPGGEPAYRFDKGLYATRVTEAWEALKTDERRAAYDSALAARMKWGGTRSADGARRLVALPLEHAAVAEDETAKSTASGSPQARWLLDPRSSFVCRPAMRKRRLRRQRTAVVVETLKSRLSRLRANPLRFASFAALGLALFLLVLTKSLPYALALSAPDLALALNPNNPVALIAKAELVRAQLLKAKGALNKPDCQKAVSPRTVPSLAFPKPAASLRPWRKSRNCRRKSGALPSEPSRTIPLTHRPSACSRKRRTVRTV